ncbi:MAG TPA: hypothetical protein VNL71_03805 [Chloroflexota bacterium]|nr:hypothetical protein [Chloroflexota bacterium]
MTAWTPALRSRFAREGWARRRDPRLQTVRRTNVLLAHADPRVLRLYACDLAERALPLWEARFPGDVRLLALLQVARRYARGEATEEERLAASRLAVMACRVSEAWRTDQWHDPAYAAGNAVGFCLWRPAGQALRQAAWWTAEAYREDHHHVYTLEGAQRFLAALEDHLRAGE